MPDSKSIQDWMKEKSVELEQLVAASKLEPRVVEAIISGRYTTSPKQRDRLAAALGLNSEQIRWGGAVNVDHMYGHGPQFGRSP